MVLPLGWLGWFAITDGAGRLTLGNFVTLVTDPTLRTPIVVTLGIAAAAGIGACVVAAPLAFLVARTDMPLRRVTRALVTASFVTPPFLGAIAWELLAAPNSGMLNQAARALLGLDEYDYVFDIYTVEGVAFAIACYTFPYVFTVLANALETIPADLEDASAILGGGWRRTLRQVTLPLVLPSLLAGGLVAFLQGLTMFGTPAILAMPAGFHTLTTRIWSLFQYPPQNNLAAAASMPLLLVTLLVLQVQRWLLGRRSFVVVGGKNSPPRLIRLRQWRWPALGCVLLVLMLPVFLPYFALIKTAIVENLSDPLAWSTLTFKHIHFALFEFSDTRRAMLNTLVLGVGSATAVTALVLVVAYLSSRELVWGHRWLSGLALAPLAVPGIVMGVGLFLVYSRPPFLLYGTLWILLVGFVTMEMPAGYQQVPRQPARPAYRARGGVAHLRGDPADGAVADHRPAAAEHDHRDLVHRVHRRDPRAVGDDPAHHGQHQGDLGGDLRPQRERRSGGDLGAGDRAAAGDLRGGAAGQSPAHSGRGAGGALAERSLKLRHGVAARNRPALCRARSRGAGHPRLRGDRDPAVPPPARQPGARLHAGRAARRALGARRADRARALAWLGHHLGSGARSRRSPSWAWCCCCS